MFSASWTIIIEITIAILFFLGIIIVTTILIVKSLKSSYRDVYKYQSKFDIELRKSINLLSKVVKDETLDAFQNVVIKDLQHDEKKNLLNLVDTLYLGLDLNDETVKYIKETYENLQEIRRVRDSKVLIFNQKILMFPFNLYAKLLKMKKTDVFTS